MSSSGSLKTAKMGESVLVLDREELCARGRTYWDWFGWQDALGTLIVGERLDAVSRQDHMQTWQRVLRPFHGNGSWLALQHQPRPTTTARDSTE